MNRRIHPQAAGGFPECLYQFGRSFCHINNNRESDFWLNYFSLRFLFKKKPLNAVVVVQFDIFTANI